MIKRCCLLLALLLGMPNLLLAEQEVSQVRDLLLKLQPDLIVEQIEPAAIDGWYQVQLRGAQILYVDTRVGFVFHGDLYQVDNDQAINLTDLAKGKIAAAQIAKIDESEMVIFPAAKQQTVITVFTDVDCSYCQRLHSEVTQLNELGISVRYLAFPNGGLSSETYQTMVSVWCAEDRQQAMTAAKQRQTLKPANCKNPVEKQYALGKTVGVQGTPSIVLQNGELVPGYLPVKYLAARALSAVQAVNSDAR